MCFFRNVLAAVLILVTAAVCKAGSDSHVSDSVVVMRFHLYYPVNSTEIHEDYMSNPLLLRRINEFLEKSPRIDSIIINSSASPDGPYAKNRNLAHQRGLKAKEYILKHIPAYRDVPDSIIIINPTAENWEGLRELVEQEYDLEDKSEVLSILDRKDISNERRKVLLKRLNGGRSWAFLAENLLTQLRYATWSASWVWVDIKSEYDVPALYFPECSDKARALTEPGIAIPPPAPKPEPVIEEPVVYETKTIAAVKTNLLYDAATLLNYSVEIPMFGDNASVLLYHQFPWWNWGKAGNEFCIRFLSVGGEARWWFANDGERLKGHFLGIYGESGKYDFGFRKSICCQGEFWSAGLSYGYAMPIGKRLNLEFSLSAGYASIPYQGYTPGEDYEILWRDPQKTGRIQYVGPTKAQVTLVVPITARFRKGGGR